MTQSITEALKERQAALGRSLTPEEVQAVRRDHEASERLRLLEDEDNYLDPSELLAQPAAVIEAVAPVLSNRIKVPPAPAKESPKANPVDHRLGNLSGTPRPTSAKKNWDKRSNARYRRRDITDIDLRLLAFLAKFKFSNSTQLAVVLGVKTNTAHRRLLGLQEVGLVASEQVLGAKLLWRATSKGLRVVETEDHISEGEFTRVRARDLETSQLGHYLGVNQVAIQLMQGHQGWFGLTPDRDGAMPWLNHFLSEYQIKSAWESWKEGLGMGEYKSMPSQAFKNSYRPTVEKLHRESWEGLHSIFNSYNGAGVDLTAKYRTEHPEVWTLGRDKVGDNVAGLYHHADLVYLPFGHAGNGVAFEIEVNKKDVTEYRRALTSYKMNTARFSQVVWVCGSKAIGKQVMKAAEDVGIDLTDFMKLVPLRAFDGTPFTGKAWRL